MKDLNQQIFEFNLGKNFTDQDFYVSKSNKHVYDLINMWPNWEKKFLNIWGESFSGKTHLINIFLKKFNGIKINSDKINNEFIEKIRINKNIIIENYNENINEDLLYTIYNIIDNENKFLLITSEIEINKMKIELTDLKSRLNNFFFSNINNPDDDLVYALIIKNFSDRQILIDKKLVNYVVKRIDRSYRKISDFIYKIDKISLKEKKSIDFKIIKKVLEIN